MSSPRRKLGKIAARLLKPDCGAPSREEIAGIAIQPTYRQCVGLMVFVELARYFLGQGPCRYCPGMNPVGARADNDDPLRGSGRQSRNVPGASKRLADRQRLTPTRSGRRTPDKTSDRWRIVNANLSSSFAVRPLGQQLGEAPAGEELFRRQTVDQ